MELNTQIKVTITLDKKEATWLMYFIQNPRAGDEPIPNKDIRRRLYEFLSSELGASKRG